MHYNQLRTRANNQAYSRYNTTRAKATNTKKMVQLKDFMCQLRLGLSLLPKYEGLTVFKKVKKLITCGFNKTLEIAYLLLH